MNENTKFLFSQQDGSKKGILGRERVGVSSGYRHATDDGI